MNKFMPLFFVLLLSGIAFAQTDIGSILFRDVLQVDVYPGSPFSGNIINDLVMYFFIPLALMIGFVWVIMDDLPFLRDSGRMKILFTLVFILFIVFSPYRLFSAFVQGAPVYIIFVIFIGFFWFIGRHFRGPAGGRGRRDPAHLAVDHMSKRERSLLSLPILNPRERKTLQDDIKKLDRRIEHLNKKFDIMVKNGSNTEQVALEIDRLQSEREALEEKLQGSL